MFGDFTKHYKVFSLILGIVFFMKIRDKVYLDTVLKTFFDHKDKLFLFPIRLFTTRVVFKHIVASKF